MLLWIRKVEYIVGISKRNLTAKRTKSAEAANTDKKNGNLKWNITFKFVQFENEIEREKSYHLWADSFFHVNNVKDQ
jgi:hypothetical protein